MAKNEGRTDREGEGEIEQNWHYFHIHISDIDTIEPVISWGSKFRDSISVRSLNPMKISTVCTAGGLSHSGYENENKNLMLRHPRGIHKKKSSQENYIISCTVFCRLLISNDRSVQIAHRCII